MTKKPVKCHHCGRPRPPGAVPTHWIGCKAKKRPPGPPPQEPVPPPEGPPEDASPASSEALAVDHCEHGECTNPKRPRKQSAGPRPRFCEDHRTAKSRKEK